jgi:DNA repair protein RadD
MQSAVDFEKPPVKYVPRDYQEAAIESGLDFFKRKSGPNEIQVLPTGCHAKGTKILMHDLSVKAVEDVVVGDKLKCPTTGGSKEVLQLCRGREMMYRVRYGAGEAYHDVNEDHVLHVSNGFRLSKSAQRTIDITVYGFLGNEASWRAHGFRYLIQKEKGDFPELRLPFSIEPLEEDDFYGFTLDGDHLYMTSDRIIHHNSGKSLIIAGIAERFREPTLILQPSKEILQQNYEKFTSYGGHAGVYSASVGRKDLGVVTFASIQSIMAKDRNGMQRSMQHFLHYRNVIVDEAHLGTSATGSQFLDFIHSLKSARILGLTATPFRLYPHTSRDGNRDSMLKFLTRTSPRIFGKVGYHIQIAELKERGYLANCRYFDVRSELSHGFDRNAIKVNSTGADYDEDALQRYYDTIDFKTDIVKLIRRINAAGKQVLCFMSSVADAEFVSQELGNSATVTGKTSKAERESAERDFKNGKLRSVCNCGVWTTGFDYPALKVVLIARPLRSLAMYYQMFGRAIRPYNDEDAWMIDACGNLGVFGRIEDLRVEFDPNNNLPMITGSSGRILTGVPLKEQEFFQGETLK